jgi:hypothetical protein
MVTAVFITLGHLKRRNIPLTRFIRNDVKCFLPTYTREASISPKFEFAAQRCKKMLVIKFPHQRDELISHQKDVIIILD